MSPDATVTDDATVSWSHTPADSRLLRALVAVPVGVVGGIALGVAFGALGLAGLLLVEGRYALGAGVLAAFVVGLARTAPHLAATAPPTESSLFGSFTIRSVVAASVGGLALLAVVGLFGPQWSLPAVVLATVVVPLAVATVLSSEGETDADAGTLTYAGTEIDCSTLTRVSRWSAGGYGVYRLSYASGVGSLATPRWLVVPRDVAPAVGEALESGVAADPDTTGPARTGVRLVAGAFGTFLLGFAGLLLTVDPGGAHPRGEAVLWYAALVAATFGALFVAIGVRGG